MSKSISKNQCIKRLQKVAQKIGHAPSSVEWRNGGHNPAVSTLCEKFGSWNRAKEAADLDTLGQGKLRFNGVFMYVDQSGHVRIRDQHEGDRDQVYLHRLIAVAEYGIGEVAEKDIHHKSGIPWDNRPDNLIPMTRSEHSKLHANK
jgi:hypothetical protein